MSGPSDRDLDQRIRDLVADAGADAPAPPDPEAFTQTHGDANGHRHSRWGLFAAIGAVAAAAAVIGIVVIPGLGDEAIREIGPADLPPLVTDPDDADEPEPTVPPTTTPVTTDRTASTSDPPVTSTTEPDELVVEHDEGVLAGLSAGVEWELSGISRACAVEQFSIGCTRVVHDPSGVPISYDATTRTLMRHVRENGEYVRAVLPESYGDDVWLLAAGPGEVVYLNVIEQAGAEGSADLVAVALAPGDAGREIERVVGRGNPGVDFDFVVTPLGLVTTDWYGQGQRPAADRTLVMPLVDRTPGGNGTAEPGVDGSRNGVDSITIDAYERTVTVNGRTWQITGQAAEFAPTGMPAMVSTIDGGFIARYDEVFDEYRSIVVRGWPDGTVDEWVVPGDSAGGPSYTIVPEPMGTVLIPNGDSFARAMPFEQPSRAWEGRLDVDFGSGSVDVTALNEHLASLDWNVAQPPWDIDPVAFADAAVGPLSSPAELRTITRLADDTGRAIITVTDERFLDDSVYATRLTLTISNDQRNVETIEWANSCQPGRGHQDFQVALCA